MNRLVVTAVAVLFSAAGARADLIPPGTRNIAIDHKIETDKDHPDWEFFVVKGSGGVTAVALDSKKSLVVAGSAGVGNGPVPRPGEKRLIPYRSNLLVAVPKGAGKKYDGEKAFHAAISEGKVAGMIRAKDAFGDHTNVKESDPRKSVTRQLKVVKIDDKDGIVLEAPKGEPDEEEEIGARPRTLWPAGIAAALGLSLGGLWLVGRVRRGRIGA